MNSLTLQRHFLKERHEKFCMHRKCTADQFRTVRLYGLPILFSLASVNRIQNTSSGTRLQTLFYNLLFLRETVELKETLLKVPSVLSKAKWLFGHFFTLIGFDHFLLQTIPSSFFDG